MSLGYVLYLDTPVTPDALREMLAREYGLAASEDWRAPDGTPWLVGERGVVLVEPPDPDNSGPHEHRQPKTLVAILNQNNRADADGFLLCLAGEILRHCPGDAVLEWDTGGTALVRRGDKVWVDSDPDIRGHLFSGTFRPDTLIAGLPTPAPDGVHRSDSAT